MKHMRPTLGISRTPAGSRRGKGFTLIELLVVIAIISILAGMLFPTFARAKASARQINCVSNSRQIAMAVSMYAQDWDDKLPIAYNASTGAFWFDTTKHYFKNIRLLHCSEGKSPPDVVNYSVNPNVQGSAMGAIDDPSTRIWSADGYENPDWGGWSTATFDWVPDPSRTGVYQVDYRHNNGAVFAFVDGHASWMPREKLVLPAGESLWR